MNERRCYKCGREPCPVCGGTRMPLYDGATDTKCPMCDDGWVDGTPERVLVTRPVRSSISEMVIEETLALGSDPETLCPRCREGE